MAKDEALDFMDAMDKVSKGYKLSRKAWGSKDIFIFLITENNWSFETDIKGVNALGDTEAFICKQIDGSKLIPWFANDEDVLEDDWIVI